MTNELNLKSLYDARGEGYYDAFCALLSDEGCAEHFMANFGKLFRAANAKLNEIIKYDENEKIWIRGLTDKYISEYIRKRMPEIFDRWISESEEVGRGIENYTQANNISLSENSCYSKWRDLHNKVVVRGEKIKDVNLSRKVAYAVEPKIYHKDRDFLNKLNRIPHLLPLSDNKVVDLRDGSLHERELEHYFSKKLKITIDKPVTEDEQFDENSLPIQYLRTITMNRNGELDNERYEALQLRCGYWLTGYNNEREVLIATGEASNSKTTFLSIIAEIMGPFYDVAAKEVFIKYGKNNGGVASPGIADLRDCRLAATEETDEHDKLNEGIIKSISGNGKIKARQLYLGYETFQSTSKLILVTNHIPEINDNDSNYDRIRIMTFHVKFVDQEITEEIRKINPTWRKKDKKIADKLKDPENLEIFLRWMIQGSIKYIKNGLKTPKSIIEDTFEYKNQNDIIGSFINDRLEFDEKSFLERTDIYNEYVIYCKSINQKPNSRNTLYSRIKRIFGNAIKNSNWGWRIKFK
jgi:P4 family phage/plasmid primase-like protien